MDEPTLLPANHLHHAGAREEAHELGLGVCVGGGGGSKTERDGSMVLCRHESLAEVKRRRGKGRMERGRTAVREGMRLVSFAFFFFTVFGFFCWPRGLEEDDEENNSTWDNPVQPI
jgi:hypothetical protein